MGIVINSGTILRGSTVRSSYPGDNYLPYTTLLLNGNGANNANNNVFLDGSTNNFAITRNGNATQGTFSPFSKSGWSNYFDGTGDYLATPSNAAFGFGTGDYTVEGWVFPIPSGKIMRLLEFTGNSDNLELNSNGTSYTLGGVSYYNGTTVFGNGSSGLVQYAWNHIVLQRTSGTVRVYVNALSVISTGTTPNTSARILYIGGLSSDATFSLLSGYLASFRIVKGSAVYSGTSTTVPNFTLPTAPLTAITNTSLLTCQSNRLIDDSTNAFTITKNGDTSVVAFSPFASTDDWNASVHGGSGYFDGTGDYLSIADNAALDIGGSDFSIETWVYITNLTGSSFHAVYAKRNGLPGYTLGIKNSGVLFTWNGSTEVNTSGITLAEKTWYHLVWSSVSGTLRMFVNGTSYYSASYSISTNSYAPTIGASAGATGGVIADYLFGYVSGFKLVKGTGVTSVTVPTQPPTATGSNLLLNFTNAGIYDATGKNNLETFGDVKISTAQSKFGLASMAFDGTGDYLIPNISTSDLYTFGTGAFTVEFWLYLNSTSGYQICIDFRPLATNGPQIIIYTYLGALTFQHTNSSRINGATLSTGQWYHIALSRSGTDTKMFLNGAQTGSTYASDTTSYTVGANRPVIGADGANLSINNLNGYIQDLRVTKGIARYTANFTPPERQLLGKA